MHGGPARVGPAATSDHGRDRAPAVGAAPRPRARPDPPDAPPGPPEHEVQSYSLRLSPFLPTLTATAHRWRPGLQSAVVGSVHTLVRASS